MSVGYVGIRVGGSLGINAGHKAKKYFISLLFCYFIFTS